MQCSECQSGSKQARVNGQSDHDNVIFRSDTDVQIVRYIPLSLFPSSKANDWRSGQYVVLDIISN